ncbi:MAG TPA: hypothetical protein PKZ36_01775 [Candidatus Paceibacterota bacterium]|nr:hypothetical protein [Candidatus Paceibacterota bacterium]HPT18116.1 hypothetical protein [Candidatus Paceibacterota bacterium]
MEKLKKYRLGNQPTEYELVTEYLGWLPEDASSWWDVFQIMVSSSEITGKEITITNPEKNKKITIIIDHRIVKDAFPMSFFVEERAKNWYDFCIVSSKDKPSEKFIIPLH